MAGFKERVLSAVILVAVLGAALLYGSWFLWILMLFSSLAGFFEFTRAMRDVSERDSMKPDILEIIGYAGIIALYIVILFSNSAIYMLYTLILLVIAIMIIYVLQYPRHSTADMMQIFFGVVYVGFMLLFVYMTRMSPNGIRTVWLIFISSWICDTAAYLSGMTLGKHKLVPRLSPKKSVEGAIGGVIGSAVVGFIYALIIGMSDTALFVALIAAVGAVISQFGDLLASAIKRDHEIKDYGSIIPGHGGILDRFDSVIITAPIVYILTQVLI